MGRFLGPDWSAKDEPVPYSKLDDPQTLNLYAYVLNNPVKSFDTTGHVPLSWGGFEDCGARNDCNGGGQTDDAVAANEAAQAAQNAAEQHQNNVQQIRENIATRAEAADGDKSYSFKSKKDDFGCNTNKCNKFVHDMAAAGADAPMVKASDGTMRLARAGELANPKLKIDHWAVVGLRNGEI
jgi:hypothetical protein